MSLKKIVEELDRTIPVAEEELGLAPPQTAANLVGRKNRAKERVEELKVEYRNEMLKNTTFIVVYGKASETLPQALTEEVGFFSANPMYFYEDLASRIPQELWLNRRSLSGTFSVLQDFMEEKLIELNIQECNQLRFTSEYDLEVKNLPDMVSLVKKAINRQIGSEIVGLQSIYGVLDMAIKAKNTEVANIILPTQDLDLACDLFHNLPRLGGKVLFVSDQKIDTGVKYVDNVIQMKDTTKKSIDATVKEIKKAIK